MKQLHIVLIPSMAQGHMIPMLDMAKLFTSRGLIATIIATPSFSAPITKSQLSGFDIGLSVTPFPPQGSSLPPNIVSFGQITDPDLNSKFLRAMELLQEPVEAILQQIRPDCIISDMFLPWTADSAAKFGIPRLAFYGTSFFAQCLLEKFGIHKPLDNVTMTSDPEVILVPGLPHELKFEISQLCPFFLEETANDFTRVFEKMNEAWKKTYGEVVNSFNELESAYANHYTNVIGRKAWGIGPLLLCSDKNLQRGKESTIDEHECLAWLDSKRPNSVVYVCFGSLATFSRAQLAETAAGLEASGQDFIWVVRKNEEGDEEEDWVPLGFEERVRNKGLIIRGWAPQVMILGVCAGMPMVTWPLFGDQFFNEKLVTEVLGIGVSVGNKRWMMRDSEGVEREAVARAVEEVMVGGGAAEMRRRAENYKEMAKKTIEEGGSSYNNLNTLIEELSNYVAPTKQDTN
ncbi:hypothetical protein SASPL_134204 [Salvia splendens]|uniref:Glycosyltransferase n=1 Tax=Salvia splendens TaxID=180675 RepID=A0A8X8X4G4_SALSN|nr:hypothetical protein SASPL_134204 [Salvia splendens]